MKKVAISACLLGEKCRYDATDNKDEALLKKLQGMQLIPFCPEDAAFGTPRPTMDLIRTEEGDRAFSNVNGEDLSAPVVEYATAFFESHRDLDLFIGKDRSPSCGVCSARVYDEEKNLLTAKASGLMAKEAIKRKIRCIDAEDFRGLV
ncbi:DUF523 domain-containing protein [Sulfurovum sp. TSL1]|uniref:DUF523 domain-containing protein n=1 Tax=Sulfurovum sp. TSL1 TaxID=2826994 RepID=UPI001CC4465E|nr:DUF523 domain-containing protein [Sulfurovum sp. TSL1]